MFVKTITLTGAYVIGAWAAVRLARHLAGRGRHPREDAVLFV